MKVSRLSFLLVLAATACVSQPEKPSEMTFQEIQKVYQDSKDQSFYSLNTVLEKSPDCTTAEKYAHELLKTAEAYQDNWNYGNAIFDGNMALGYCSALKGDLKSAKEFFVQASRTPGSPQLNSFGLVAGDMRLAEEFLKKGEKQLVLQLLKESKRFWKTEEGVRTLSSWEEEITDGKIPNFKTFVD